VVDGPVDGQRVGGLMRCHITEVQTEGEASGVDRHGRSWSLPRIYWWRCTCARVGPNKTNELAARNGGRRHVAAMEKR
jgi:hypothetical protein